MQPQILDTSIVKGIVQMKRVTSMGHKLDASFIKTYCDFHMEKTVQIKRGDDIYIYIYIYIYMKITVTVIFYKTGITWLPKGHILVITEGTASLT